MTRRWEIGDHAPASEARTRCDRTFCGVKYVLDELIGVKTSYISNLYVMWGWEMGDHAPASKARASCGRKNEKSISVFILQNKVWRCQNFQMQERWDIGDHAPASKARTSCDRIKQNTHTKWMREMNDHTPAWEARTRCDRTFWGVGFVYIDVIGIKIK